MNFGIKRLSDAEPSRQYHLFDGAGTLIMVADQGSPWMSENRYQVRFARPDGQPMAVLDWPQSSALRHRHGLTEQSFAIVLDDAVYAILTAFCRPVALIEAETAATLEAEEPAIEAPAAAGLAYMTVDVGEARFLVLAPADGGPGAKIYAGVPDGLAFYGTVDREDLPDPIGHVNTAISYTYIAELPAQVFTRQELIVLALAYLLDDACRPVAAPPL